MTFLLVGIAACVLAFLILLGLCWIAPMVDEKDAREEELAETERWAARTAERRRGVR